MARPRFRHVLTTAYTLVLPYALTQIHPVRPRGLASTFLSACDNQTPLKEAKHIKLYSLCMAFICHWCPFPYQFCFNIFLKAEWNLSGTNGAHVRSGNPEVVSRVTPPVRLLRLQTAQESDTRPTDRGASRLLRSGSAFFNARRTATAAANPRCKRQPAGRYSFLSALCPRAR